jgi:hypothetical protein
LREGEDAADVLAGLRHLTALPGHLIHMPAHIFLRVGRWHDALEVFRPTIFFASYSREIVRRQ